MTSPKLNLSLLVNTGLRLEFKAKKRVTISDYSFVARTRLELVTSGL